MLVLGLPRGGVAVAYEVARALGAPLDVFVVRKLEEPGSDAPLGLIAAGGVRILDAPAISARRVPRSKIDEVARREALELSRLERYYRDGRQPPKMTGREVILVDDGLTAPAMLQSAADALLAYRPARAIVAIPAADGARCAELASRLGDVVCALPLHGPTNSSDLYERDDEPSDRDVRHFLSQRQDHRLAG